MRRRLRRRRGRPSRRTASASTQTDWRRTRGRGGTSTPTCGFDDESGVLRAQTNYNSVTVDLSLLTSKNAAFVAVDMTAENCEVGIENAETGFAANEGFAATLRLEISAPATPDLPRAHFDDGLRIAHHAAAAADDCGAGGADNGGGGRERRRHGFDAVGERRRNESVVCGCG